MPLGRFDTTHRDKPMSDINMTPLVDVMLVLVAILIVTAPLLASRIALDLPKAGGAQPTRHEQQTVRIALQADGRLYLDDVAIDQPALAARLKEIGHAHPDAEVQLRADRNVPYGQVVGLMGLSQQAGLTRIGFVADQPAQP